VTFHYSLQIRFSHYSPTKNELGKGLVKIQTFFDNNYLHRISHFYIETELLFSDKILALTCRAIKDEPLHPIRI
jgi:hypothetical protein